MVLGSKQLSLRRDKNHTNSSNLTKNRKNRVIAEEEQGRAVESGSDDGSNRHHLDSGMGKIQGIVEIQ